ncbi:hypothetical protein STAS_06272, partial [Striga asiatica]
VPFTRGCSNYSLSVNVDKLVIKYVKGLNTVFIKINILHKTICRKAQILIESPIKLGIAALTIFKIVSSLFDAFPAATEVLNKPTCYVPTTTKGIQTNHTAHNRPSPSMVHQTTKHRSLHSKLHSQNTLPPREIFSQIAHRPQKIRS